MREAELSSGLALTNQIENNLWETWSNFGRGPGCALHDEHGALWFETPVPIIPYNGVLKFQVSENPDRRIGAIVEHFQCRQVPFMWIVHPSSQPTDLPSRLTRYGLKDVEPIYGMARSLADLPEVPRLPEAIEIRKVADERDASAFYQFAAWRWNIPKEHAPQYAFIVSELRLGLPASKAHLWQAWRKGRPVAKAGMYLGSGSAGIYGVATKPEARRFGLARALTLIALHEARTSGYQVAVLHSTPMAEALYQSIGFATLAEFRLFASEEVMV
ncbi:MAG: GNAT family N-acetyltransferase [Deltaproteobacteria bacterium]|nr:GNAT family N-acetyltransferase [Deltaproteobacteria bacterium]